MSRFDDIYLIRHVESELNATGGVIGGRSNHIPATPRGIKQGQRLGRTLREKGILPSIAYMSPAVRTQVTARESLVAMGLQSLKPIYAYDIQELSQGRFEGMPLNSIYTEAERARIEHMGRNHKLDDAGAESFNDVSVRMFRAINRLSNNVPYSEEKRNIFLYTHGNAIKSVVGHLLDLNGDETFRTEIRNSSITKLSYGDDGWEVDYCNMLAEELPNMKYRYSDQDVAGAISQSITNLNMNDREHSLSIAAIYQDYLGGEIEATRILDKGINDMHFRNITSGRIVDLAMSSFTDKAVILPYHTNPKDHGALSIRELAMADKKEQVKYRSLRLAVSRSLKQ